MCGNWKKNWSKSKYLQKKRKKKMKEKFMGRHVGGRPRKVNKKQNPRSLGSKKSIPCSIWGAPKPSLLAL